MADDADRADKDIQRELSAVIKATGSDIPPGQPGTCRECGADFPRLVDGMCVECREYEDKRKARRMGR